MRAQTYLAAAGMALLAACSDATGPDLSLDDRSGTVTTSSPGRTILPPSARQVTAK